MTASSILRGSFQGAVLAGALSSCADSERPPRRHRASRLLAIPSLLALGLCVGSCGESGTEPPLNALLITLDTTRADALSCYGLHKGITPHLDRLAQDGVRFDQAYTVAPLTLPAHSSMMTGLYPIRHSVRENGLWPLPETATTLAERAQQAGYQTAACVAAVVLDERFGLAQGFDVFDGPDRTAEQTTSHYTERDARSVIDAALAWYENRDRDRPFFLWVHLFDPHAPHEPPPAFARGPLQKNPYLGEVAFMDAELGRLFDGLRDGDDFDETFVMVVGDHGEAFGEHGEVSHGPFCYEPTLRVPYLIRDPGDERRGVSQDVVSVVDVHPTLAEAMGLGTGSDHDGVSLFRSTVRPDRGIYFESYAGFLSLGWSPLSGWRDKDGKYLHSSSPQYFDIANDPNEATDLLEGGSGPDVRPSRLAIAEISARPRLAEGDGQLDEELLEELRGLGYTTTGAPRDALPDPLSPSDRPSPQEKAREHYDTLVALQRFNSGDVEGAHPVFERIASDNPRNTFVLDLYAYSLMRQGRHSDAIAPLERLLAEGPERADSRFNLGVCLGKTGRVEPAIESFQRALELDPDHIGALGALIQALNAQGRGAETEPLARRYAELSGGGQ